MKLAALGEQELVGHVAVDNQRLGRIAPRQFENSIPAVKARMRLSQTSRNYTCGHWRKLVPAIRDCLPIPHIEEVELLEDPIENRW